MKKAFYIILVAILVLIGLYLLKRNGITSRGDMLDPSITTSVSTNDENRTTSELVPTKTTSATSSVTANSTLQAGSIKLISPKNNQTFTSGSTIDVQYELTNPIFYGVIVIGGDMQEGKQCYHTIDHDTLIGIHSFQCTLPNTVNTIKIGISELLNTSNADSKNVYGQLSLVAPANLKVKDIEYYPEETIFVEASPQIRQDGNIDFTVVYNDGSKRKVDVSGFSAKIADTSIVTLFGTSSRSSLYFDGKKVGKTTLTVSYKGITKLIPIETYPYDDSQL